MIFNTTVDMNLLRLCQRYPSEVSVNNLVFPQLHKVRNVGRSARSGIFVLQLALGKTRILKIVCATLIGLPNLFLKINVIELEMLYNILYNMMAGKIYFFLIAITTNKIHLGVKRHSD